MTELSLIVPCYNEAQNVDAFYDRCLQVFEPAEFEVIFVNDGSKDDTYKKLQHLHEEYSNVLVVNFPEILEKRQQYMQEWPRQQEMWWQLWIVTCSTRRKL